MEARGGRIRAAFSSGDCRGPSPSRPHRLQPATSVALLHPERWPSALHWIPRGGLDEGAPRPRGLPNLGSTNAEWTSARPIRPQTQPAPTGRSTLSIHLLHAAPQLRGLGPLPPAGCAPRGWALAFGPKTPPHPRLATTDRRPPHRRTTPTPAIPTPVSMPLHPRRRASVHPLPQSPAACGASLPCRPNRRMPLLTTRRFPVPLWASPTPMPTFPVPLSNPETPPTTAGLPRRSETPLEPARTFVCGAGGHRT